MPNWTEQNLHVVGSKADVDRFIRTGYLPRSRDQSESLLDLHRLCPLKPGEPKTTYTHDTAVVLTHWRTRTQAFFGMVTSWDYPAAFYGRLATHWPSLHFACAVNGEMGDFGGTITVSGGAVTNLVQDYGAAGYNRRSHSQHVGSAMRRWGDFLTRGRDWRLLAHRAWQHGSMPFDAHFDDDFWFYFPSREEMARFRARYRTSPPFRRAGNEWNRTR